MHATLVRHLAILSLFSRVSEPVLRNPTDASTTESQLRKTVLASLGPGGATHAR